MSSSKEDVWHLQLPLFFSLSLEKRLKDTCCGVAEGRCYFLLFWGRRPQHVVQNQKITRKEIDRLSLLLLADSQALSRRQPCVVQFSSAPWRNDGEAFPRRKFITHITFFFFVSGKVSRRSLHPVWREVCVTLSAHRTTSRRGVCRKKTIIRYSWA